MCACPSSRQALSARARSFLPRTDIRQLVDLHSDLAAHWKIEYRPKRKLLMLIVEVIIGFGLGWVPGSFRNLPLIFLPQVTLV